MTNTSNRPDARARVALQKIGNRDKVLGHDVSDQITRMMSGLDQVMTRLPETPPENMVAELDRITNTLRTADQELFSGNVSTGLRALDLAHARLDRFAKLVERYAAASPQ